VTALAAGEFERRLEQYGIERSEEARAVRVGEKETSQQAAIVARYADLFTREQLEELRAAEEAASGPERESVARLRLVAGDRVVDPRHRGLELVARREQRPPLVVEAGRHLEDAGAERVPAAVVRLGGEARLRRPQRELVAVPGDASGEQRVLELVLALGELAVDEAFLALEAETGDRLAPGAARSLLGGSELLELLGRERALERLGHGARVAA
jgi:hypothetical protein